MLYVIMENEYEGLPETIFEGPPGMGSEISEVYKRFSDEVDREREELYPQIIHYDTNKKFCAKINAIRSARSRAIKSARSRVLEWLNKQKIEDKGFVVLDIYG